MAKSLRTSAIIPPELKLTVPPSLKKLIIAELKTANLKKAAFALRDGVTFARSGEYKRALLAGIEAVMLASSSHKENPDLAGRIVFGGIVIVQQVLRLAKTVQELQGFGLNI